MYMTITSLVRCSCHRSLFKPSLLRNTYCTSALILSQQSTFQYRWSSQRSIFQYRWSSQHSLLRPRVISQHCPLRSRWSSLTHISFYPLHRRLIISAVSQMLISRIIIHCTQHLTIGFNQSSLYCGYSCIPLNWNIYFFFAAKICLPQFPSTLSLYHSTQCTRLGIYPKIILFQIRWGTILASAAHTFICRPILYSHHYCSLLYPLLIF